MDIVHTLTEADIDKLVALYSNEYWCKHRTRADVARMLKNTDIIIGVKDGESGLIGFARVLTDYVYRATIYDVIVEKSYRGKNIGKLIVDEIIGHEKLKNLESLDLFCKPEMFEFYEKWGFTTDIGKLTLMRRKRGT
ncbi:MAG: GNAT family N-acetyltransferase [Deltaproteobacteria bacterium]|nr:GNAT family N-acetyltransferase [Deltaproteobacteria bacterium]